MSVRLPNHLVGDPPEYLTDLPLGATWHFAFWDMWVDIDRTCYLDPAAKRCPPGAFYKIQVKRDAAGYHVVIEDPRIRYVPRAISSTTALIPVVSLTEHTGTCQNHRPARGTGPAPGCEHDYPRRSSVLASSSRITMMSLYDSDLHAWALRTAADIRAGAPDVDWHNVAEEIESLGRSEEAKLVSLLEIILIHLLKWQHQPVRRSRSWELTLAEHRRRLERHLRRNPSLQASVQESLDDAYDTARFRAANETGLELTAFPEQCPYTWDRVCQESWLPG